MTSSEFSGGVAITAEELIIVDPTTGNTILKIANGVIQFFNPAGTLLGQWDQTQLQLINAADGSTVALLDGGIFVYGLDPNQTDNPKFAGHVMGSGATRRLAAEVRSGSMSAALAAKLLVMSDSADGSVGPGLAVTHPIGTVSTNGFTVQGWNSATLKNGFTGSLDYRMMCDGSVLFEGSVIVPAVAPAFGTVVATMPAGFIPTRQYSGVMPTSLGNLIPIFCLTGSGDIICGNGAVANDTWKIMAYYPVW